MDSKAPTGGRAQPEGAELTADTQGEDAEAQTVHQNEKNEKKSSPRQ
jgi:hypothetical protein